MRRLLAPVLVAGALVVPSQAAAAGEGRLQVRVTGAAAGVMAGCRGVDVARIGRSALGFVVYKFHVVKRWCWAFPRVTSVTTYAYASDIDPNWDYKGVIAANGYFYRWCCGDGRSGHYSFRQGKFENCVFTLGCIRREYPWVKIWVRADGGYSYATGT
ncbi:MAG TPA: hypothetical protein VHF23_08110 [Gaiellaceae bacterium]|nr:hypothetical protein [Gaiellaceae bacterium]